MLNAPTHIPRSDSAPNYQSLDVDDNGYLVREVLCRGCSYNLRGLLTDGNCPECWTAIARSLKGDHFRYCNPQWVRTLARGMNLTVAALAIGFIGGFLRVFTFMVPWRLAYPLYEDIAVLGVEMMALVGFWKITSPEPIAPENPQRSAHRKTLMVCRVTAAVLALILIACGILGSTVAPVLTGRAITLSEDNIQFVGLFISLALGSHLSRRLPNASMTKQCRAAMLSLVGIIVALFAISRVLPMPIAALLSLPLLGVIIWAFVLLFRLRGALSMAARQAEGIVSPQEPPSVAA